MKKDVLKTALLLTAAVLAAAITLLALRTVSGEPPDSLSTLPPATHTPEITPVEETTQPPSPEPEAARRVTLVAAGDNLIHNTIVRWAKTADAYDFSPAYSEIRGLVQSSDMSFINQETPMAGDNVPFSGYPRFNSPSNVAYGIRDAGFSIVNLANNHALDKNEPGLLATAELLNSLGMTVIGANRSENERSRVRLLEAGGVRFAWLSYTYGTNGIPFKNKWIVNLIDEETIKSDVESAKSQSDAVIVSMHWGEEYRAEPTQQQKDLAKLLADLGVALVIGHHPHVLESAEWITGSEGSRTFVAYSLGNLISSQDRADTMLGGILKAEFTVDGGRVSLTDAGVMPVVTHFERGYKNFRVYPLSQYTDELASRHFLRGSGAKITLKYFSDLAEKRLGEFMLP